MGKVFGNWCSFGPFSIFHQRAATPAGEKIEKSGVMEKAGGSRYICICILVFLVFLCLYFYIRICISVFIFEF